MKAQNMCAVTLHLGTGLEDDAAIDRLAESVLQAQERFRIPMWIETHRATATQDIWRTVQLVKRFPELRFNADLSHWYTGLELAYGDWDAKMAFITPVLERTAMMHGRIGNTCCMQVDVGDGIENIPQLLNPSQDFMAQFSDMWQRCAAGFCAHAPQGAVLPFLPELILAAGYYARAYPDASGEMREESDRYQQALVLLDAMAQCFDNAQSETFLASG